MTRTDKWIVKQELRKIRGMVAEIRNLGRPAETVEEYINRVIAGYDK